MVNAGHNDHSLSVTPQAGHLLRGTASSAILLALLLAAPRARAEADGSASVRGVVVDGQTHGLLDGASVRLLETGLLVSTNTQGQFSLGPLRPGEYTLEVSRVGYRPTVVNRRVGGDSASVTLLIHLFPQPIQTSPVIVTGVHEDMPIDVSAVQSGTLLGQELQRDIGQTLASTLKHETGLAMRSMGPAPARPVLRGLGGDRVLISEDGFETQDLSATSPDHAVTVEPFTVERIEVIRGPRILLRTPTTIGGVVNIVRNEIPSVIPDRPRATLGAFGESASSGYLGSIDGLLPLGAVVLRGEYSGKRSSDIRTPVGTLGNSAARVQTGSLGGSFIEQWGYAGAAFREYDSDYGVPGGFVGAHPQGVDISVFRRHLAFSGALGRDGPIRARLDLGRTYYEHVEFEKSGAVGAEFRIVSWTGVAEADHGRLGPFRSGTWGFSVTTRDFSVGGFVFTPPTTSVSGSISGIEEISLGALEIQAGLRVSYDRMTPARDDPDAQIGPIRQREYWNASLSGSALYQLDRVWSVGLTISRSTRVPTIEELYSEGPHLAAYSYEVGNPLLNSERGTGFEALLRQRSGSLELLLTGFWYELPYYIITRNTGELNYATLLPIYSSTGVRARLAGGEAELLWRLGPRWAVSASLSYTRGTLRSENAPLPAIPPLKAMTEIQYFLPGATLGIQAEMAAAQNRVDRFEEPTAGYAILHAYGQVMFSTGIVAHNLSLMVDNILDQEYRNHLSRVKSIMPEAGRNLRIVYRLMI